MSRNWTKPNHNLPGWSEYHPPGQKTKDRNRLNKRRRFKGAVRNRKRQRRQQAQPALADRKPVILKYLELQLSTPHISTWKRKHGHWRCIASTEPYEWFLRVAHPDVIRQYLWHNNLPFIWHRQPPALACLPDCTASNQQSEHCPDGITPLAPQGDNQTAVSLNNDTQAEPRDGQSAYRPALERNSIINPRRLMLPECSGISKAGA